MLTFNGLLLCLVHLCGCDKQKSHTAFQLRYKMCCVQELVGSHNPLSMSPPLTSDLWALGMLMCFLFVGGSVFDPAQYVDLASDGLASPASKKPKQTSPVGRRAARRRSQSSYLGSSSLIGRFSGAFANLFSQRASQEGSALPAKPVMAREEECVPEVPQPSAGSGTRTAAMGKAAGFGDIASMQIKQLQAQEVHFTAHHRKIIADAKAAADVAASVNDLVNVQLDLLVACGASQGAQQDCSALVAQCFVWNNAAVR